jgi:hypothetical protein
MAPGKGEAAVFAAEVGACPEAKVAGSHFSYYDRNMKFNF